MAVTPLNPVYPFVFMDCIHYKVREDGRIVSRAAYVVLGVTAEGYKEILSITVGANETSKFWLGMLNDLHNRGVKDVLFFCVDGLPGFKEAIQAVFPKAEIQRCVIHMLRNSFKYVSYKDLKKFASDFKAVYNAPNESAALSELENIKSVGRNTLTPSATGKTIGKMSALSSSSRMTSAGSCTPRTS